jgi:phosphatidate cytidylyltransferase
MSLNPQVFRARTITALFFVIVMMAGLFVNYWSFVLLFFIIHAGCWYEFIKLQKRITPHRYFLLAGIVYISSPILMLCSMRPDFFISPFKDENKIPLMQHPVFIPCVIIFSIWINDTMAYLVGSFIGKTPFSKISPKKTWEGIIGGVLLSVFVVGFAGSNFFGNFLPGNIHWYVLPFLCGVFGTLGDLLESKLKRMANVKDSGSFMPGHGGFLDRFDSLLIAAPAVWVFIYLFF